MKIIAITGRRRSGKDTVADYLVKEYGYEKFSLADPMKLALSHLFGFTHDQLWENRKDEVDERWGLTPREVMQLFGGEFLNDKIYELFPDLEEKVPRGEFKAKSLDMQLTQKYYTDRLLSDTLYPNAEYRNKLYKVAIADMRYLSEAEYFRKRGATIWKIIRPSIIHDDHASESEVDLIKADVEILNNGSIDDIYEGIREIMQ